MELLLVIVLIGTMGAIAVPGYARAPESARITRATGDIRTIGREAGVSLALNGCFPSTLADMKMDYLRDPWGRPYEYGVMAKPVVGEPAVCTAPSSECLAVDQTRKDGNLVPLNSDFDVYSLGPDGLSVAPVSAPESLDDIVRASNGGYFGLGRD